MNVANSTFYNRHLKRFTIKSVRSNIVLATIFSFVFIFYGCSETHDFELVSKQSHLPINKNITVRLILQSPDQKWLATVGEDHWVRIWGRKTNSLLRSFVPGKEEIKALHFYGNDKLAIVTKKPKLLVYSILTGKQLFSQDLPKIDPKWKPVRSSRSGYRSRYRSRIRSRYSSRNQKKDFLKIKFSQTGRYVAVYTTGKLTILDLNKRKVIKTFDNKNYDVRLFDFSWPGEELVIMDDSAQIVFLSLNTFKAVKKFKITSNVKHHKVRNFSLVAANKKIVFSGWRRGHILIWDLAANARAYTRSSRRRLYSRFFRPGNLYVDKVNNVAVVHNGVGEIRIISLVGALGITKVRFRNTVLNSVVTSQDGKSILIASQQKASTGFPIIVADSKTGLAQFQQHNIPTHANILAVHTRKNILFSVHHSGAIHQWKLDTGQHISTIKTGIVNITSLKFTNSGKNLIAVADGRKVFSYNISKKKVTQLIRLKSNTVKSVGLDSSSNRMFTGYSQGCIRAWNMKTGQWLYNNKEPVNDPACQFDRPYKSSDIQHVIYNKRSNSSILSYDNKHIKVRSSSGHLLGEVSTPSSIHQIRSSSDGKLLAATVKPNYLYVWNVPLLTRIHKIQIANKSDKVSALRFSKDNKRIYVGNTYGNIFVYDSESGQKILQITKKRNPIVDLVEGGNGKYVVSSHLDNSIRVTNIASGKLLYIMEVFPQERWVVYRPGRLPVAGSRKAEDHFLIRKKNTLLINDKILTTKKLYIDKLTLEK